MSAVIEFPAERRRKQPRALTTGPGKVIIFPGVRVEHLEFDLADRIPLRAKRPSAQVKLQEDYNDL